MVARYHRIRDRLQSTFQPTVLEVVDESAEHAGHEGGRGLADGETHFHVEMVSTAFAGLTRLQRSRAVHEALDAEFAAGLHALSLSLAAPEEILRG